MDEDLKQLHLESGRISGQEKTCGKKIKYETEDKAQAAATNHNRWKDRRHDVEPYPCCFCSLWHVGNIMSPELMRQIIEGVKK